MQALKNRSQAPELYLDYNYIWQGGGFDLRPVAFEAELSKAFSGNSVKL